MVAKIALEEHFLSPGVVDYWRPTMSNVPRESAETFLRNLTDFGEQRLQMMDRAEIARAAGAEVIARLAELTAEVFGLDASLLRWGRPDPHALPPGRIPYDTSLDATATAAALGMALPSAVEVLRRFRRQRDTGMLDECA